MLRHIHRGSKHVFHRVAASVPVRSSRNFHDDEDSRFSASCTNVYELAKNYDGNVDMNSFLTRLEKRGILRDDPRITDVITSKRDHGIVASSEQFKTAITRNTYVYENAFAHSNVIPDFERFSKNINEIYRECAHVKSGKMADYIPELAKQNPDHFGLSICTVDGQRINVGDTDVEFCVQSCSKPISYCIALEEHGYQNVHNHVGREPSGIRFNALQLNEKGLPHNPLINSGAIAICSLIKNQLNAADRFGFIQDMWKNLSGGRPLGYSNPVYLSERATGDRNYALAYFMRENGAFPENVTNINDVLEFYFQCCSLMITSNTLSIIAATLANGGVCPLTGIQVFSTGTVKNCLSMMYSCGMYDYSGEFAFTIGLPAKSGVAGGVFTIVPNVMGICTFSPPLDKYGNSVKGVNFCKKLVDKYNFHLFTNSETSTKENPLRTKPRDGENLKDVIELSALGDVSALREIHIKGDLFDATNYDLRTALHVASSNGHLDVVRYLCEEKGVCLNQQDRWNRTPLDDALMAGHNDVSDYLISRGGREAKDEQ